MFVIDLKPDMVWTGEEGQLIYWSMDAEAGADRQERKNQEVVSGCSERRHQVMGVREEEAEGGVKWKHVIG